MIGVGNMGAAMVHRLLDNACSVTVRDIRSEAEAPLLDRGATRAASPAALAATSDVILVVVVDAAQVRAVLFDGPEPAAPALRQGQCVCLQSTIAPDDTAQIAARLAERGIMVVDAPISGGPARARAGTLSIMASGDSTAIRCAAPVLELLSARLFVVGPRPGQGAAMKLVNNLLAGANLAAAAEAFALGQRVGLEPQTLVDVIGASWASRRSSTTGSRGCLPATTRRARTHTSWRRTSAWRWRWRAGRMPPPRSATLPAACSVPPWSRDWRTRTTARSSASICGTLRDNPRRSAPGALCGWFDPPTGFVQHPALPAHP